MNEFSAVKKFSIKDIMKNGFSAVKKFTETDVMKILSTLRLESYVYKS